MPEDQEDAPCRARPHGLRRMAGRDPWGAEHRHAVSHSRHDRAVPSMCDQEICPRKNGIMRYETQNARINARRDGVGRYGRTGRDDRLDLELGKRFAAFREQLCLRLIAGAQADQYEGLVGVASLPSGGVFG